MVGTTPGGRKQLQLQIAREAGAVRKLRIQKVPTSGDLTRLEPVLDLDRDQAVRLIDALKAVEMVPAEGDSSVFVDDQLLRDVLRDPQAVSQIYSREPGRFRELIESDADASDVVALEARREVVETMRSWLRSPEAFEPASREAGGPEHAWQLLLEANPWIFGIGLGGQIYTSWANDSLEQTVVGRSIKGVGKRADGLLRTGGVIRAMAFVEIKHHETELLERRPPYRAGCWAPSKELAGAVVQAHQTVHLAAADIGDYLQDQSPEGEWLPNGTFLLRPRSFVIAGSLRELVGPEGGPVVDKVRSFELFRRHLQEPEVLTFDELLARAEWHVALAASSDDLD